MPEKKKYENALNASTHFDFAFEQKTITSECLPPLLWFGVRALLGIWRELDTISALYRDSQKNKH